MVENNPKAWFECFHKAINFGCKQSNAKPTMFIKHTTGNIMVLFAYVDDVITGNNVEEVSELNSNLSHEFKMIMPLTLFYGN